MRGIRGVALGLVVLLLPFATATDWPQYGHDEARTGALDGRAPPYPEIALQRALPIDEAAQLGWPIVVGREVIVAWGAAWASALPGSNLWNRNNGILGIHLDTGVVRTIALADRASYEIGSDGSTLYTVGFQELDAWDLATGAHLWTQAVGRPRVGDEYSTLFVDPVCAPPLLADDTIYAACSEQDGGQSTLLMDAFSRDGARLWPAPFVANLGQPRPECSPEIDLYQCAIDFAFAAHTPNVFQASFPGPPTLSTAGGVIFVGQDVLMMMTGENAGIDQAFGGYELYAVRPDGSDGRLVERGWHSGSDRLGGFPPNGIGGPTGDADFAYTKAVRVHRYPQGSIEVGRHDATFDMWGPGDPGLSGGLAYTGDFLYAAAPTKLYRVHPDLVIDQTFSPVETPLGHLWAEGPLVVFHDAVLARYQPHSNNPETATFVLVDSRDASQRWTLPAENLVKFAVADEALIVINPSGLLTVYGTTDAAPALSLKVNTGYPAPGAPVRVDLGATTAGVDGPATSFRADWGDGTQTPWQTDPVLVHRYADAGDATARFWVRNDGNQTSTATVLFAVGADDPAINIFNSPFADRYQETTFFLLGLLITMIFALAGIYRAGRKRRRLERELRALEAAYKETEVDPGRCEAMLAERRALARALFLRRKLEEAHASFLIARVDELRQGLRLSAVEQRLDFLPQGMVRTLREMLRDTRITEWERTQFLEALRRDTFMSSKQKAMVQDLIDGWFAGDAQR